MYVRGSRKTGSVSAMPRPDGLLRARFGDRHAYDEAEESVLLVALDSKRASAGRRDEDADDTEEEVDEVKEGPAALLLLSAAESPVADWAGEADIVGG